MSDRDDLEELIAKAVYCVPMEGHSYLYEIEIASPGAAADAVLAAGWRPATVTPEQVERALRKLDTVSGILNSLATDAANGLRELDNIRAGLSVAEDGEQ